MKNRFVNSSFALWITMSSLAGAAERGAIVDRNGDVIATGDRQYPAAEATAHLVGYCQSGEGRHGKGGLEEAFDAVLAAGEKLQLNIDLRLQTSTFEILKESGHPGAAVVIDPGNGEVLAMVSYPSYDPNEFAKGISTEQLVALAESPSAPLLPRATEATYPPASTFKTFSSLALLANDMAGPQTCSGTTEVNGKTFRCWKASGHGNVTDVRAALRNSCNCYYYQAAVNLPLSTLVEIARAFGYGSPSGIETTDSAGALPSAELGSDIQNAVIGHGHTKVTPLQIANAYATVANGGTLYRPHLVAKKEPEKVSTLAATGIQLAHLETVKAGLIEVVEHPEGTGRRAKIEGGLRVAGKTGTAAIANDRSAAIFAGYAPVEKPRFAICVVQEGDSTLSAGEASAPLAGRILARADALRKATP